MVFVLFDGTWVVKDDERWVYKDARTKVMEISIDATYRDLLDKLYEIVAVDRLLYDLKIEAPYKCGGMSLPPHNICSDDEVAYFMKEISMSVEQRIPLCVTPIKKNMIVDVPSCPSINNLVCTERVTSVPETYESDRENNDHVPDDCSEESEEDSDDGQCEDLNLPFQTYVPSLSYVPPSPPLLTLATPCTPLMSPPKSPQRTTTQEGTPWKAPIFTREDIEASSTQYTTSSTDSCGDLFMGKIFQSKEELKTTSHLFAMKNNFEFLVRESGKDRWFITCKDRNCTWKLRGKQLTGSSLFEITVYVSEHSCSQEVRHSDHRQAAPWVIGHLIKSKYAIDGTSYLPKNIKEDMKRQYGIDISYEKAWRCREKAIEYVRGSLEASYSKLPAYLHVLREKNPGTLIDFVTADGRFLYCFFSIGAVRRGFASCRHVICVDGTHLKTKYGGILLCAVALDANSHLYPIAFGVVDSENHESWIYFLRKLKEAIGDVDNLAFVSDRHKSINHALQVVFPDAYHGACYHHISMNVMDKFKTDNCHELMYNAAFAFRKSVFDENFRQIRQLDPRIAQYLQDIGFDKWARSHFPGNRYNIMTSNYAESFNNKTRNARSFPITSLHEFIRFTLQIWFFERRDLAASRTSKLTPLMEKDLAGICEKAKYLQVFGLNQYEFHVMDGELDGVVNLVTKTCTCGVFQMIGIPCVHAAAAAVYRGVNIYSLCDPFYSVEAWRASYADSIYPCGCENEWVVPDDIRFMDVRVPVEKRSVGRPKKSKAGRRKIKRLPSQGEKVVIQRKCSKCGGRGHNRATCTYRR